MVARLRLGNKLDERRGEITKTTAAQAFACSRASAFLFARKHALAHVVKPIFTLARQYPERRL
jgi:hypothetical protein